MVAGQPAGARTVAGGVPLSSRTSTSGTVPVPIAIITGVNGDNTFRIFTNRAAWNVFYFVTYFASSTTITVTRISIPLARSFTRPITGSTITAWVLAVRNVITCWVAIIAVSADWTIIFALASPMNGTFAAA